MIRSLIISALILIAAALLGLREKQQLSREKAANEKLLKVVGANPNNTPRSPINFERRKAERAMKEKVQVLNRDFFALYRVAPENPAAAFAEERLRIEADLKSRLGALTPAEIKLFMDEFNNNPDLNLPLKQALNNFVQKVFIWNHPIEMARMMSQSPEKFGIGVKGIYDPFEYLVYYYSGEKYDLATVFQCLSEAPPEFQSRYIGGTVEFYAFSAPTRTELLEEMRAFASTPEQMGLVKNQLPGLVFESSGANTSFIQVSDWLESANLSRDELAAATRNMHQKVRVGETGQWLDWLAKTGMPATVARERAFELATAWTEKDYQAAGNWLNNAPSSPQKCAVTSAYAAKVYPYDPEGAMQWIQTLPQGPDRTRALQSIYQGMQKNQNYDSATEAVEAFAREHRLNE